VKRDSFRCRAASPKTNMGRTGVARPLLVSTMLRALSALEQSERCSIESSQPSVRIERGESPA